MQRFLTLLTLLCTAAGLQAQPCDTSRYAYPVEGVSRLYAANFGEMRPDHFHSGVDIKTDGATGKRVVAVADGYVCRVSVSPWGYGRALYVAHPDGTTSVYGHLSRFRSDIEEFVRAERLRTGRNRTDITCEPGRFPVLRGQEIARSGNTGQSFGPHLHFEIRDTRTQRTLNTIAAGAIPACDDIAPYIVRLHYIEVDTVRGVPIHRKPRSYDVVKRPDDSYALMQQGPLPVGGCGYFVLEATDRKNGVSNTFGLYRISAYLDGEPYFEYRMDGYTFDQTRYCNAVSCFPMQIASRNEAIRLARLDGAPTSFYTAMKDNGVIKAAPGQRHTVRIEAEDDCNNCSQLTFRIEGRPEAEWFRAEADSSALVVDRRTEFRHNGDDLTVRIPAEALYESVFYRQGRSERPLPNDASLLVLSPVYTVLDNRTPLHTAATVSVNAYVPPALQPHTVLATRSRKEKIVPLGGGYANGRVTARTRTLGELFVAADTVPPRVEPLFKTGADFTKTGAVRFRVSDNFSGVERFSATLDGQRAIIDYLPVQGILVVPLGDGACSPGRRHRLCIEVTDGCTNTARREVEFFR